MGFVLKLILILGTLVASSMVSAETITVATAANFKSTLETLSQAFESNSEHEIRIVAASTGVLYNQIIHGAPFDIFLSADAMRADKIAKTINQTAFTYALGKLVYWQPNLTPTTPVDKSSLVTQAGRIAIANPQLAPYGQAAQQLISQLKINNQGLIKGNNVNQVYQFVASGNVQGGLIALSQVLNKHPSEYWLVPSEYYSPIEQKAVLLNADKLAAVSFYQFLRQPIAADIIRQSGYGRQKQINAAESIRSPRDV